MHTPLYICGICKVALSIIIKFTLMQKVSQPHVLFLTCVIEDEEVCRPVLKFLFCGNKILAR